MKTKRLFAVLVLLFTLVSAVLGADKTPSDDFINDSVRQRLAGDAVVKGGAIEVDVKGGVVTLSGHVQEPRQKDKAESLTKKIKGVKSVVNKIQIVPQ